jgi:hypothetical protein
MNDFDPYAIIENVMNDTLDSLGASKLNKVNFMVVLLAYGYGSCIVIPRAVHYPPELRCLDHDVFSIHSNPSCGRLVVMPRASLTVW